VIYVPVYQPELVYVRPPPEPGRFYVSFGAGLVVGAWLNHDCDWHAHEVIVWHQDHPRPADWWYHPSSRHEAHTGGNHVTVVNNTTIVNQNFTVWRPRAAGAVADRGDRGWGQPDVRVPAPTRNEGARPARPDVRQPPVVAAEPKPVPVKEVRPAPPVQEVRPSQPEVQRPPARVPLREASTIKPPVAKAPAPVTAQPANGQQASAREATPASRPNQPVLAPKNTRPVPAPVAPKQSAVVTSTPRPATPPATSRPAVSVPLRPPSGALAGIESSRVTREASARGQQSREAIAKPVAAARPAPAPVSSPKANSADTKKPQNPR